MDDKQKKVVSSIVKDFQNKYKRNPKDQKELAQFVQTQGGEKYIQRKTNEVLGKKQTQQEEQTSEQKQKALHGAKLNYFKSLKNQCAEDEEVVYYKKGGSVGCGCKKKEDGGQVNIAQKGSVIDKFKQTYKKATESVKSGIQKEIKKKSTEGNFRTIPVNRKQVEEGKKQNKDNSKLQQDNALRKGGEIKKNCGGAAVKAFKAAKCGSKLKKHLQGGSLNRILFMQVGTSKNGIHKKPKSVHTTLQRGGENINQEIITYPASYYSTGQLATPEQTDTIYTDLKTGQKAFNPSARYYTNSLQNQKLFNKLKRNFQFIQFMNENKL